MIGLVKKDALVLRKVMKSYMLILAVMLLLGVLGVYDMSFATSFIAVMVMMLPISSFAYDEQAKWDGYAIALPLGRRAMVGARYLFALLVTACVAAFSVAFCVADSIVHQGNALETIATILSALGVALFITDVMLPLNYKFGPERARPYLYAVVFIPIIVFFGAWKLGLLDNLDLSWLKALPDDAVLWGFALVPLAALLGMGVSFLISCRIMGKKEL